MNPMYGYPQPVAPSRRVTFDWIGQSWQLFQQDAGQWIAAMVIYGAIYFGGSFVFGLVTAFTGQHMTPANTTNPFVGMWSTGIVVFYIFAFIFMLFAGASLLHMAVKKIKGEMITLGDAFSGLPYMGPLILYSLIQAGISIVFGVFLSVMAVPMFVGGHITPAIVGVYLLMMVIGIVLYSLLLPGYAMVCDGVPAGRAMSQSIGAMKTQIPMTIGFWFVLGLIIAVSMIPCFLGLLVTYPMMFLILAIAYRDLIGIPNIPPSAAYQYGAYGAQPQPGTWPPPPNVNPGAPYGAPPYGQNPGGYPPSSGPSGYGPPPMSGSPYYGSPQPPSGSPFGNVPTDEPRFGVPPPAPSPYGQFAEPAAPGNRIEPTGGTLQEGQHASDEEGEERQY